MAILDAVQEVGTDGRTERNRMREIAASPLRETLERNVLPTSMRSGTNIQPIEVLWGDNNVLSLRSRTPCALIYKNLFDDEGEEIIPRAWRP
jgi:hypothetical protein